jgi:hypothetical protein
MNTAKIAIGDVMNIIDIILELSSSFVIYLHILYIIYAEAK